MNFMIPSGRDVPRAFKAALFNLDNVWDVAMIKCEVRLRGKPFNVILYLLQSVNNALI